MTSQEMQRNLEEYNDLSNLLRVNGERPENWILRIEHVHSCMLGDLIDFSATCDDQEVVTILIKKMQKRKAELQKLLNIKEVLK